MGEIIPQIIHMNDKKDPSIIVHNKVKSSVKKVYFIQGSLEKELKIKIQT